MNPTLISLVLLVLGIGLGALISAAGYQMELRRIERFMRERDPESNARLAVGAMPGVTPLVEAVNAELDRSAEAQVHAVRHQQEFQRDLSALSHDIRTPLMGAKGYLQLAGDEGDAAVRAGHLDAAARRIDATTELLDQLFAYTKSTDPDLSFEMVSLALRPFVEEVLLSQYPAFEERGWEPAVTFEDDGVFVEADRDALARILSNLVVNALRHGTAAPSIEEYRADGRVMLCVSNDVSDADVIDVDRLFDRFYQADTARGSRGSGLGLSVAANLARAMGAKLTAELHDGRLTITLSMPA